MIINTPTELKLEFNRASKLKYPLMVEIKPVRATKRSNSQNALWQAVSRSMADLTGYSHAEMKVELQKNILGTKEISFDYGGHTYKREIAIETPDVDSNEFSQFIDKVLAIAIEMGIEL